MAGWSTPSDSLVATSQLSIVQAAIDASEISAVIVAPTQGDGVYIAMDHGFKVENLWQKDLLVIGADDASFSFSTIYVAIADDRSDLARDNYGNVKTYDYNDAVDSGFNLKSAVLMQDHIADDDGGYGQKILVDFEQVSFNNWSSEVRISHEYQTWHNENDGHSGLGIRGSLINEIFKFGAAEFTDLSANNIQTIDIRDSAGDDATIILSKQVNVNFYINEGDDYLYLNEELGAAQPDNAWYQASLEDYEQARFEIEAVSVVLNTDHMAQRDVNGQWILAHPTDANAVDAILITDLLQTGIDLGSNLLVGVERVRFSEMTINTGITEHTWTSDDGTVELRQEGTAFGERLSIKLNADGSPTDRRWCRQ